MIRIIPAIDIIGGKCVRLRRGDYNTKIIYDENPLKISRKFEDTGFKYLHLVDLDGARKKKPVNLQTLEMIARNTSLKIDFGGGLRNLSDVEQIFSLGAAQITAGSISVENRSTVEQWLKLFGPQKVILGADVFENKIAISGWTEKTELNIISYLKSYMSTGIRYVICTQILRDGVFSGPDISLYRKIKETFPDLFLIASGGIRNIADVQRLADSDINGVIIGKAIYEKRIKLKELEPLLC